MGKSADEKGLKNKFFVCFDLASSADYSTWDSATPAKPAKNTTNFAPG